MVEYLLATDEQKEIAALAKDILDKELAPRIHDLEKANDGRGEFPMDVAKTLAKAGLYACDIPEEWGGLGFDLVTTCVMAEEMAKVDAGFAFNFVSSGIYFPLILRSGLSREEKQKWADRLIAGEAWGSFCTTESCAGSDTSAIRTTAVQDGDEWVINGSKCFVTGGKQADHYFVIAWTDKTKSQGKGMTMFLVERDRPGVQVGRLEDKMGLKLSETCDMIFDNVRVPADHIVGQIGAGMREGLSLLHMTRCYSMSFNLGLAQAALDCATKYAQERQTWNQPIIKHEGLGFLLADMKVRTDASRSLLYYVANCVKDGKDVGTLTSCVKVFVSDSTMQTTLDAIQVLGGYGYMKDYPVEKLARDAKIFQIFDGTNQIQRMLIARELAKKQF